ncbi:hypothetical protein ACFYWU_33710 [Streptomyces chrestomyceticus]|uniref:hypothetical protein n=1 Tax=Streptomyces chrestomyceticus TaxID=68185 RepID=UPI003684D3C9
MRAEHEAGQHGVVGGGPAVAPQQEQVAALCVDDVREPGEIDGGVVDVGRADPGAVPQADVGVVGQEPDHPAAKVAGIATVAASLRLVAEHLPVRLRVTQFRHGPGQCVDAAAGQRGEPFGDDDAAAGSGIGGSGDL